MEDLPVVGDAPSMTEIGGELSSEMNPLVQNAGIGEFSALKLLWQGDVARRILSGEDTFPVMVELSLTMACDLRCVWCVDLPWRTAKPGTVKVDVLKQRLEEMYERGTRAITIEGGGEPTLHPQFDDLVVWASDKGFQLGLITHGGHLGKHMDVLGRFQWVRVSLDAYDEDTYERLKGVRNFEKAMKGLEDAVKVRERVGRTPTIGVGYLSSELGTDVDALQGLTQRLSDIGVDYVQFRRIQSEEQFDDDQGQDVGDIDLEPALGKYRREGFEVYLHQMDETGIGGVRGNAGLPCIAHRLSTVIGGSGDMYLCCRLRTEQNSYMGQIGSIYDGTIDEIWSSPKRQAIVKMVADPKFTKKYCPECRLTKYNVALHQLKKSRDTSSFV